MKPKALFLCTGNSARSQMAEGFLRHIAGEKFEVLSAGTNPTALNPLAVQVMQEAGIDISGHHSKDVRDLVGTAIQYVITVCSSAAEKCPIFPGTYKFLRWDFEDPAAASGPSEAQLLVFRRVRDEIFTAITREFGDYEKQAAG